MLAPWGEFAEQDDETGWNAFELRMYDSQIGRWMAPDPYGQYWSPCVGMGNNPESGVDPDGGFKREWWANFKAWLMPKSAHAFVFSAGSEYFVGYTEWGKNSTGAFLRVASFSEGGPGWDKKDFESVGFEVGFSAAYTVGFQSLNDYGLGGTTVNFGAMTVWEIHPKLILSLLNGVEFDWGLNYFGKNGKAKFTQSVSYEGGIDTKAGRTFEYDLISKQLTHVNTYGGGGVPWVEAKLIHDSVHGGHEFNVGLQEDVSKSFFTSGGLSHGLKFVGNFQATITNR